LPLSPQTNKANSNGKWQMAKFKLFYICHLLFAICHLNFFYRASAGLLPPRRLLSLPDDDFLVKLQPILLKDSGADKVHQIQDIRSRGVVTIDNEIRVPF